MNAAIWVTNLRSLLEMLRHIDLGYPMGINELFDPKPRLAVNERLSDLGLHRVAGLVQFYSNCDGVSLPDVHTGYFIKPIGQLTVSRPESEPTSINGQFAGDVQTIGSTGGGGLFVLRKKEQDILYLPPGPISRGVYDGTRACPKQIARHFDSFLDMLLGDLSAFVENTPNHTYIV
jgi:hypothetical protein